MGSLFKKLRILRWLQQNLTPSMGLFSLQGPVELHWSHAHEAGATTLVTFVPRVPSTGQGI